MGSPRVKCLPKMRGTLYKVTIERNGVESSQVLQERQGGGEREGQAERFSLADAHGPLLELSAPAMLIVLSQQELYYMSRRVVTSGGGGSGMSLSDRFSALSQARSQGSVASHIPRNSDRNDRSDRGGRGGARGRPSDRGVQKAAGQQQRRDDRQGKREGGRGRGRGNGQRGGRDGGKPRDGKGKGAFSFMT